MEAGLPLLLSDQTPWPDLELCGAGFCLPLSNPGRFAEAMAVQKRLFNLMRLNFIEVNPVPVKAGLVMMGLIEENYRLPMVPMSDEKKVLLRAELEKLGLIP